MVPFGVGELLGSIIIGPFIDKYSHRASIIPLLISLILCFTLLLIFTIFNQYTVLMYFMTFIWGIFDSFINNLRNCMSGFEFESNNTPYSVSSMV